VRRGGGERSSGTVAPVDEVRSRPLRVVQVVCTDGFGGIERYVTTLANGLAGRGCRVSVLGGQARRMSRELSGDVDSWHPARGVPDVFARLALMGGADIVHAHMSHAELAGALARPFTRANLVVTRHFPARRGATTAGRMAALAIRRAVDLQLASSADVAARVDGASEVVLPGVPTLAAQASGARSPVVLVLQRLEPEKDTVTALRAWAHSGLADQGWTLEVAGDGRERSMLERLAAELPITGSCRFLGTVEEVAPMLARASILLATGPDEAFGLSVVEAMAAALPVVATRSGGHLENVGACPDAVLFGPRDWREAGRSLRDLAADTARRDDYGRRLLALQRERFSAERQVGDTLALYRTLVDEGR
jgi:glycosyltransferase involved in cell wall biosynthesis